jgi:putative tricarboxylic transport membrane protein
MKRREQIGALFWLAIAVFVCIESFKTGVGRANAPGAGFFPFWSAVVLGSLALALIIVSAFGKKEKDSRISDPWRGLLWRRVVWLQTALFIYPIVLYILGYLIATFGLMIFSAVVIERSRMWRHGIAALLIVVASHLVFNVFLDCKLPKGIFGF